MVNQQRVVAAGLSLIAVVQRLISVAVMKAVVVNYYVVMKVVMVVL